MDRSPSPLLNLIARFSPGPTWLPRMLALVLAGVVVSPIAAQQRPSANSKAEIAPVQERILPHGDSESDHDSQSLDTQLHQLVDEVTTPDQLPSTLKALITLAVLSLAPAILLMTTCYVRVVVVLSLLRQAFGAQNLPPNQVVTALALFVTLLVMAPVWNDVKTQGVDPYVNKEISWEQAWEQGTLPVKRFMSRQISSAENQDDIMLFYQYLPQEEQIEPETYRDVPLKVLLPAFIISELKIAFLIGFQVFLPFLVIDLLVSSVTISMGMYMLPPMMISLPLKVVMFVIVDGWHLVIGLLLESFAPYT